MSVQVRFHTILEWQTNNFSLSGPSHTTKGAGIKNISKHVPKKSQINILDTKVFVFLVLFIFFIEHMCFKLYS